MVLDHMTKFVEYITIINLGILAIYSLGQHD